MTPNTRAQSHFSNYMTGKELFMLDHTLKEGVKKTEMVIISKDKDVIRKHLREAIRINRALDGKEEVMRLRLRVQAQEEEVEINVPILLLNRHTRLVQVNITDLVTCRPEARRSP